MSLDKTKPHPSAFRGCHGRVKEKSTDFEPVEGEEGQVKVMARKRK